MWDQAGRNNEHMVELWVPLFIAGKWDQMAFKGLLQLKWLYDCMIQWNNK